VGRLRIRHLIYFWHLYSLEDLSLRQVIIVVGVEIKDVKLVLQNPILRLPTMMKTKFSFRGAVIGSTTSHNKGINYESTLFLSLA
jgi:hypothetical protein